MTGTLEEWREAIYISRNYLGHHIRELRDQGEYNKASMWFSMWLTLKFDGPDDEPFLPSWVPNCVRSPPELINCMQNLVYISKLQ